MPAARSPHRSARRERRRTRELEIVGAARALFDQRARREASVGEIAHAAKVNKAMIYRSFDSKDEIFALALADYLDELSSRLAALPEGQASAVALTGVCECYVDFCLEYPAFVDCALALMQGPVEEMRQELSGSVWSRLGRSISACVAPIEELLAAGAEDGAFAIADASFAANRLIVQVLGSVHLARFGAGLRQLAPGVPETFEIDLQRVRSACLQDMLALVGSAPDGDRR